MLAVTLCFGLVLWMQLFHASLGATEHNELPFELHWLRDSILALPLVFAGVWAGLAAARIRLRAGRGRRRSDGFRTVVAVALTTSFALSLGSPVHAWLFRASEGHDHGYGAATPSPLVHIARDALVALPVGLFLTAAAAWFLFGQRSLGRRFQQSSAKAVPTTSGTVVYDHSMLLTRGDLVKVGVAGGVALFLPFRDISSAYADDFPRSPKFTPFTRPLPIPAILQPVTDPLNPTDTTTDYYELGMATGSTPCLPLGQPTKVWCYDDAYPGSTIMAMPGRPVKVKFTNNFTGTERISGEPVANVIHLHGGHQVPKDDGFASDFDPATVPGLDLNGFKAFRSPIHQGKSGTCSYPNTISNARFGPWDTRPPRAEDPKSLWYHDHIDVHTGEHVYMGLAGCYCIDDGGKLGLPRGEHKNTKGRVEKLDFDIPILLQDRLFDANNQLVYPVVPHEDHDGVLGDTFLVNGCLQPFLDVQPRKYRFRIYNGSNRRWYNLGLSNGQQVDQIATEAGFLRAPVKRSRIVIAPAERVEVVVDFSTFGVGGGRVYLTTYAMDLDEAAVTVPLVEFRVAQGGVVDDSIVPTTLRTFEDWPDPVAHRSFEFDSGWEINGRLFDPRHPMATPKLWTTEIWTLKNGGGGWVHPIHIHDVPHRVLTRGAGGTPPPWEKGSLRGADTFAEKDTVALGPDQEVQVALNFVGEFGTNRFTGPYALHCHNTEHEDMAMMARFDVMPNSAFPVSG